MLNMVMVIYLFCNFCNFENLRCDNFCYDHIWHLHSLLGTIAVVIMILGFTTTYAIWSYHHSVCCEFESCSLRGVQHYVITFVSDLWLFPPPRWNWNIVKHHKTNQTDNKLFASKQCYLQHCKLKPCQKSGYNNKQATFQS